MPTLEAPTLDELTIAAIKLVDAIVEYRRPNPTRISTVPAKASDDDGPIFRAIPMEDLLGTDQKVLRLRDTIADPVSTALKRELKVVGQAIYDIVGSSDELVKIGEKIASTDRDQYSRRMSPLDSAWNAVGSGNDRWWS